MERDFHIATVVTTKVLFIWSSDGAFQNSGRYPRLRDVRLRLHDSLRGALAFRSGYSFNDQAFYDVGYVTDQGLVDPWQDLDPALYSGRRPQSPKGTEARAEEDFSLWDEKVLRAADVVFVFIDSDFMLESYRRRVLSFVTELHEADKLFLVPVFLERCDAAKAVIGTIDTLPHQYPPDSDRESSTDAPRELAFHMRRTIESLTRHVGPVLVFYSYAHTDEDLRAELEKHLASLRHNGLIRDWHDRRIVAGSIWAGDISAHLEISDVILALLSADFVSSHYCWEVESRRALERHHSGDARLIPILVRPVLWHNTPYATLQALPRDGRAVTLWPNKDLAFVDVCEGLLKAILDWRQDAMTRMPVRSQTDRRLRGSSTPSQRTRSRILDAAFPNHVYLGRTAILVVLIRLPSSGGLAQILEVDTSYGMTVDEARSSSHFGLTFPVDRSGRLSSITVAIHVECPDFDLACNEKNIDIPPRGDSHPVIFLLIPRRDGRLFVNVEVQHRGAVVGSCVFAPYSHAFDPRDLPSHSVASMTVDVEGSDNAATQEPTSLGEVKRSQAPSSRAWYDRKLPQVIHLRPVIAIVIIAITIIVLGRTFPSRLAQERALAEKSAEEVKRKRQETFDAIKGLSNPSSTIRLSGTLTGACKELGPTKFDCAEDQESTISISNSSSSVVFVYILNLGQSLDIRKLTDEPFLVQPAQTMSIQVRWVAPFGKNMIKVIGTRQPIDIENVIRNAAVTPFPLPLADWITIGWEIGTHARQVPASDRKPYVGTPL